MHALTDFYPALLISAGLLLAAVLASIAVRRLGAPAPIAFLAVGIAAGLTHVAPVHTLSAVELEKIGALALYAILFQGGLSTGFRAWRANARPTVLLGTVGTAATAAGLTAVAHGVLGLDWSLAALVGLALSPTDPAAVYATLRSRARDSGARAVLEGESGFNDPVAITLMVVAVGLLGNNGMSIGHGVVRFAEELVIGVAGGLAGALLLIGVLRATPRLEKGLQAGAMLIGAVVIGAATASLHGSGFLAVYCAGLLLADRWAQQEGRRPALPEGVAAVSELLLFALLGAVFAPAVGTDTLGQGVVLTLVTLLVLRPLVVAALTWRSRLRREDRVLVAWGGLKGAVPLLLAAYPALESLPQANATQAIVLVATATSLVVQGASLPLLIRRLGHEAAPPRKPQLESSKVERVA